MKICTLFLSCGLAVLTHASLAAFDLASPYRASFLQSEPDKQDDDWRSSLSVRFGMGDSTQAFDGHEEKTELFNAHGAFDLTKLGLNLQGISLPPAAGLPLTIPITLPKTNAYYGVSGPFSPTNQQIIDRDPTNGRVVFSGRFKTTELDVQLKQNLMWGLYAHIYVPLLERKVDRIAFKNIGPAVVNTPNGNVNIDDFMTGSKTEAVRGGLPALLKENGFSSTNITNPFKQSGIGDVCASLGWQGYADCQEGIISSVGGMVQFGGVFPTSPNLSQDIVFAVPLGYDNHIGVVMRSALEAGLWRIVTVGGQAGVTIFFRDKKDLRMRTYNFESVIDDNGTQVLGQNGLIVLGKGHADTDKGQIWDLAGYLKFDQFIDGFEVIFGYSYTKSQITRLSVEDSVFLDNVVQNALNVDNSTTLVGSFGRNNRFISKDAIVNTDSRLSGWESQVLHFVAQYCYSGKMISPLIRVEYDYPFLGKYTLATDMISGTLGVSVGFGF